MQPLSSFPWPPKPCLHPFLSTHSLEMCTESLGNETGSSIEELPYDGQPQEAEAAAKAKAMKKVKSDGERRFPPPLTSIRGVQVQAHREDGRLVMKAVTVASSSSCFQAERGNGRLRLSLVCRNEEEVVWSSSRCNGDISCRLQSWPFCVAIS